MNKVEINKISMKAFEEKLYELNNNKVTYKSEFTHCLFEEYLTLKICPSSPKVLRAC